MLLPGAQMLGLYEVALLSLWLIEKCEARRKRRLRRNNAAHESAGSDTSADTVPAGDLAIKRLDSRISSPRLSARQRGSIDLGARSGSASAIGPAVMPKPSTPAKPETQPGPRPAPIAGALAKAAAAPTDQDIRAKVQELVARLPMMSHFEILGVTETASAKDANDGYLEIARQFHPDRLMGPGLRDLAPTAGQIIARAGEAVAVLSDPQQRAAYVAARSNQDAASLAANLTTSLILEAETTFLRGEALLEKGDPRGAADAFRIACEKNPAEPQYSAYLAWSRFEDSGSNKDALARETLSTLQKVASQQPQFGLANLWIGKIYQHLNEPDKAARAFREATNFRNVAFDAERELRIIEMRKKPR